MNNDKQVRMEGLGEGCYTMVKANDHRREICGDVGMWDMGCRFEMDGFR